MTLTVWAVLLFIAAMFSLGLAVVVVLTIEVAAYLVGLLIARLTQKSVVRKPD